MIPSSSRPAREPLFNLPGSILVFLAILVGIHAVREFLLAPETSVEVVLSLALVPVRWSVAYGGVTFEEVMNILRQSPPEVREGQLRLAGYILMEEGGKPWTGLTYALLHGSWSHVFLNGLWLAAFGTPIARRWGAVRFFILVAATALGGAIAHTLVHPYSPVPMVGVSASVSGLMAGAVWFIFSSAPGAEPHRRSRERLRDIVRNRRVLIFLIVWLATNYVLALVARPLGLVDAGIAWEAHMGGFAVGLVLFPLLDPVGRHSGA